MSCYVLWNCVPSCHAMQCNIVYSMSVCFCMCIKGHHVCQILNNLTLGESHANMTLGHRVPSSHGGKSAKVRFSFWFLFWYLKLLVSQISFFKQQKVWEGMMLGMFSSISPPPVEFTDFPVFYPFKISMSQSNYHPSKMKYGSIRHSDQCCWHPLKSMRHAHELSQTYPPKKWENTGSPGFPLKLKWFKLRPGHIYLSNTYKIL